MATLKKRYRFTLDFEIEVDDITQLPLSREGFPDSIPGKFIVKHLAAVKQFFREIVDSPEVLDAYLRYYLVLMLGEGINKETSDDLAHRLDVDMDCEAIIEPVIEKLEGVAAQHLGEAQKRDMLIYALDKFWGAIQERLVDASLIDVE